MSPLIQTDELAERLGAPNLVVLDATWRLDGSDARADWLTAHIPGARFFDIDALSDHGNPLPHMLAAPEAFAHDMERLGVSHSDSIVVYDQAGLFSAARAWWMLSVMGARDVRVLDGGLPKWGAEGRPLESGAPGPVGPARFQASFNPGDVVDFDQVRAALDDPGVRVLDARGRERFAGRAAEPRPGVRAGHMPGAGNLPYADLLREDGTLRPAEDLRGIFDRAGLSDDAEAIVTCGSGVTAAILSLALAALGRDSRLYDGSWAEWGARQDAPIRTGEA